MTDRELMQQALDALDTCDEHDALQGHQQWFDRDLVIRAIEALRARLAQPEPWTPDDTAYRPSGLPQRKWQGLTDGEIKDTAAQVLTTQTEDIWPIALSRAIEAKLREKNA